MTESEEELEFRILGQDEALGTPRRPRRLPEGTVTMVLTDIEGSTALLHELGSEAYAQALETHRRVLHEAVAAHNGTVVDSQGDALFAVFPRAEDAVEAATEAQEAFAEGAVRVRFGMHTGEPLVRNDGYVGIDLHRAARIMSVGHGGQVVVSETTARLLDDGVELRDLGLHRLKDMTEPQQLYQLGAADFPPLRSLNQTNLPAQTTPIVGRETELAELHALIADDGARLLTLSGPGGSGKTRLALQAVAELVERNPAGVFWVSLAALESHELVLAAIAHALDVREVPGEPLDLTLRSFLSPRRMLLLLDNFEHVLPARTRLAELLAACPQLQIVVTSRAALKISGERVYEVPPLAEEEAVELFVERARQAGAEVARDATVAAICTRLDYLPLAIELAAARLRLLAPAGLLQRLDRRLPLLREGAPDLPERQQTLYATIAWSHDLLDEQEKTLFRRLSVFAGSFTLESAEAVAQGDVWGLESLVAKSLVRRWASGRLGLLETIREYAAERLDAAREAERVRNAHAEHYVELALALAPYLSAGERRSASLDQLGAELDNFGAVLLELERREDGDRLLRLATALWRFWMARGTIRAGQFWLERGLQVAADVPADLRAHALEGLGVMQMLAGDVDEGVRTTTGALELFRALGDARGAAESLNNIGTVAMSESELDQAESLFEEAAELARAAGEWPVVALALGNLSAVAVERGDDERGVKLLHEEAEIYARLRDPGRLAMHQLTLARMLVDQGRNDEAARLLYEGLAAADALPQREFVAMALITVAAILIQDGNAQLGAELLGAVDGSYEAGLSWRSAIPADRATRDRTLAAARVALGPASFDAAYSVGRAWTFDQALGRALAAVNSAATPPSSSPS